MSNDFSSFLGFLGKLFTFQDPFEEASSLFRASETDAEKALQTIDSGIDKLDFRIPPSVGPHVFPKHPLEKVANMVYSDTIAGQWTWFKYILESTFVTIAVLLGVFFLLWLLG